MNDGEMICIAILVALLGIEVIAVIVGLRAISSSLRRITGNLART